MDKQKEGEIEQNYNKIIITTIIIRSIITKICIKKSEMKNYREKGVTQPS